MRALLEVLLEELVPDDAAGEAAMREQLATRDPLRRRKRGTTA
jgi:hypothetical protein